MERTRERPAPADKSVSEDNFWLQAFQGWFLQVFYNMSNETIYHKDKEKHPGVTTTGLEEPLIKTPKQTDLTLTSQVKQERAERSPPVVLVF